MYAALAVIAAFFSSTFARFVLIFLAVKVLLLALMVTVLPVVLNNLFYSLIEKSMNFMDSQTGYFESPLVYQASGLMGYLVDSLYLPECLSMLLSALSVRFMLKVMRIL